jgi:hypothetical protein
MESSALNKNAASGMKWPVNSLDRGRVRSQLAYATEAALVDMQRVSDGSASRCWRGTGLDELLGDLRWPLETAACQESAPTRTGVRSLAAICGIMQYEIQFRAHS